MTICTIKPMPEAYRNIKKKIYRPQHPPTFMDIAPGGLTPEDIEEAIELFKLLDDESRDWWGGEKVLENLNSMKIKILEKTEEMRNVRKH